MNEDENTCVEEKKGCPKSAEFSHCICDERFGFCSRCEKGFYYVKYQARCIAEVKECAAYYEDDVTASDVAEVNEAAIETKEVEIEK